MHIKKILETRIDINDINIIFSTNYDKSILQILKDKYVGRCFKSVYILDILKIIKRSDMNCKSKVLDGSVYVDVMFEVLGMIYERGDIIHNCKVLQINNNGVIHGKSKYASLYIKNIEGVAIFKELDEIPVVVNMARYGIYNTEISVSAIPLIPILNKSTIFRIVDSANVSKDVIKNLFDFGELSKLKTSLSKSNKDVYKFFRELLYPFKVVKKVIGKSVEITLDNLMNLKNNDLVCRFDSYLDDSTYSLISESDINKVNTMYPDTSIIDIEKQEYIIHILYNYNKNLFKLLEFIETYNSKEKIKEKSTFFSLYKTFKK